MPQYVYIVNYLSHIIKTFCILLPGEKYSQPYFALIWHKSWHCTATWTETPETCCLLVKPFCYYSWQLYGAESLFRQTDINGNPYDIFLYNNNYW